MTDSKVDINREEPEKAIAIIGSVADARPVGGLGTERLTTVAHSFGHSARKSRALRLSRLKIAPELGS